MGLVSFFTKDLITLRDLFASFLCDERVSSSDSIISPCSVNSSSLAVSEEEFCLISSSSICSVSSAKSPSFFSSRTTLSICFGMEGFRTQLVHHLCR